MGLAPAQLPLSSPSLPMELDIVLPAHPTVKSAQMPIPALLVNLPTSEQLTTDVFALPEPLFLLPTNVNLVLLAAINVLLPMYVYHASLPYSFKETSVKLLAMMVSLLLVMYAKDVPVDV